MAAGRNAPCPCGSGKKYKACCMRLRRVNPGAPARIPLAEAARRAKSWQVDAQPLALTIEDDPNARPVLLMVTAQGLIIHSEMLRQVSPELGGFVAELEQGLRAARRAVQGSPAAIEVRTQAIADALASRLATTDLEVPVRATELADIDMAYMELEEETGGSPRLLGICRAGTWKAWGLPGEWVSETFRLARSWMAVRPWEFLSSDSPFTAQASSGQVWHALVLGSGGLEMGLGLYSDLLDFEALLEAQDSPAPQRLRGRLISLTFDEADLLTRAMHAEIRRAGWPVAGPAAYPVMFTVGCLGGGLSRADAGDLQQILAGLLRWTEAVRKDPGRLDDDTWQDPAGSVLLDDLQSAILLDDEAQVSIPLQPGFAQGPGADPQARLEEPEDELDEDEPWGAEWLRPFEAALTKKSLKAATIKAHLERVELFLTYLVNTAGVPLPALHEYDLLVFLFDWYPRKVIDTATEAKALLISLGHFFRFLAQEAGISCPWSKEILDDRATFLSHWRSSSLFAPRGAKGESFDIWQDIEDRVITFGHSIPGVLTWQPLQGLNEALLYRELQDRWLLWREELLSAGTTDSQQVFRALEEMAAGWLQTSHPSWAGKTPVELILAERRESERRRAEREERERP